MNNYNDKFEINRVIKGGVSGFIAGLFYAVILSITDFLSVIAGLLGSDSFLVGLILHLIISTAVGSLFGYLLDSQINKSITKSISFGVAYGIIWWFLGSIILFPIFMGLSPELNMASISASFPSLVGHLLYGLVLGVIYPMLKNKS